MSNKEEIYLDTYLLQQDMRVRMPKTIISNLNAEKGKTKFDIFLNPEERSIILRVHEEKVDNDVQVD